MHKWIDCIGQFVQYFFCFHYDYYYYCRCRCCALLAFHWNGIRIFYSTMHMVSCTQFDFFFLFVRSFSSSFKYSLNEWSVLNLEFQSMSNGMVIQLNGNCSVWMNGYKICIRLYWVELYVRVHWMKKLLVLEGRRRHNDGFNF